MSKPLLCIVLAGVLLLSIPGSINAQFRWPRERAFEIGAGGGATSGHARIGYIRFYQPKRISEIPFNKRFKSLIGLNRYVPLPCKQKPKHKAPPGVSTKLAFIYEVGSGKGVKYQIASLDASFHYIIQSSKTLFISLAGGVSVSNNRLLVPITESGKQQFHNRIKYGVLGGFEVDKMINKQRTTSVVLGWEQYYLAKTDDWGNKRWYGFIGLRFNILTW